MRMEDIPLLRMECGQLNSVWAINTEIIDKAENPWEYFAYLSQSVENDALKLRQNVRPSGWKDRTWWVVTR